MSRPKSKPNPNKSSERPRKKKEIIGWKWRSELEPRITGQHTRRRGGRRGKEIGIEPGGSSRSEARGRGVLRSHKGHQVLVLGPEEGDQSRGARGIVQSHWGHRCEHRGCGREIGDRGPQGRAEPSRALGVGTRTWGGRFELGSCEVA